MLILLSEHELLFVVHQNNEAGRELSDAFTKFTKYGDCIPLTIVMK